MAHILLLDADSKRCGVTLKSLQVAGYSARSCVEVAELRDRLTDLRVDLFLLHAPLDADPLLSLTSFLREQGHVTPLIILCDSTSYVERVRFLRAGADDVLSQPYALEELLARIHALLRRTAMGVHDAAGSILSYGDLMVNTDERIVVRAGQSLRLTVKEYDLLLCLLRHQHQVMSRQKILQLVWGETWVGDDNLLDVYIRYLRKKLERQDLEPLIHTVRGVGFVFR